MVRRLPPLIAIRAFDAFVRTGTMRGAAGELCISHTVVSRHIQNLEEALGTKLVVKAGRGLALTPEGTRYSLQVCRAFDTLADATRVLQNAEEEALHICCMAGLASRRLLRRLPELEERLNGRDLVLQPTSTRVDFRKDGVDAEIIYLDNPETGEGLRSELIVQPRILAVASPGFRMRNLDVRSAADLVQFPLIHERSTRQWETWFERASVTELPRLRGPKLWHGHLTLESAKLGQGVALVSDLIAAEALDAGDLVEMAKTSITLGGYYFVAPSARWNEPAIRTVRQWLHDVFPQRLSETERHSSTSTT